MTRQIIQDRRIAKEIRIRADFAQSSSSIVWQDIDDDPSDDTWHHSSYQVADARHDEKEALRLVRNFLAKD
ncbi:MAG: hypothetical protein KA923_05470 [Opitutaceae bacterium]|nr:hypothetical protein [Opitutaceae bacterium]